MDKAKKKRFFLGEQVVGEEGRYETLRSLGDLLLGDFDCLQISRRKMQSKIEHTNGVPNYRRSSFLDYLYGVKHVNEETPESDSRHAVQDEHEDVIGTEKKPLPDIQTVHYKDTYEMENSDDSDTEGIVTITPFVEIRKARVSARGHSKLDDSFLRELRDKISRFDFEHKYKKSAINNDEFQSFVGDRYLDLYNRRHGIVPLDTAATTPSQCRPKGNSGNFSPLFQKTYDNNNNNNNNITLNKSYVLNAKIHALAMSQNKSSNKPSSAVKLPPINNIELNTGGYDSSPEVTSHRDKDNLNLLEFQTARSVHSGIPLYTAIRARKKRFPQHERYRDLLHELRKLSSIVQKADRPH